MVLMLQSEDDGGFYALSHISGDGMSPYSLWSWPAGEIVNIEPGDSGAVPGMAINAISHGIPIPRDGSLFGWVSGDAITALIVIYAEYAPSYPEPGWAVMPLAGTSETQWPPFTGQRLFGHWSWEQCQGGSIISLDDLIAETPDTVCWVDTKAIFGSDSCAVARDIRTLDGHVLRRGSYIYYQVLRTGTPVPSLEGMLADPGTIDLAPRFQRYRHTN